MATMSRKDYATMYGPTSGDAVRLGDTSLLAEIEHDHAVPGDECLHGGGKTLRDGMGLTAGYDSSSGALDMLVCNVVVMDPVLGVVKGDIGIKDGLVAGIGKAGNPAVMDGVDTSLVCGASTTVRDAEGLIATPGGIDVHVHFDSAQLCEHALSAGVTTMIGGSLGPITVGIDCGGAWNVGKMLQAAEHWPINFGFLGRGNSSRPHSLPDQLQGGCLGLKIHEDWGAMPAVGSTLWKWFPTSAGSAQPSFRAHARTASLTASPWLCTNSRMAGSGSPGGGRSSKCMNESHSSLNAYSSLSGSPIPTTKAPSPRSRLASLAKPLSLVTM